MAEVEKGDIRYKCDICGAKRGPRKRDPAIPPQCCGEPMKLITPPGK